MKPSKSSLFPRTKVSSLESDMIQYLWMSEFLKSKNLIRSCVSTVSAALWMEMARST